MKKLLVACLLIIVITISLSPTGVYGYSVDSQLYSSLTYTFLNEFVTANPKRAAGTQEEKDSAKWLASKFESIGYVTDVPTFQYNYDSRILYSQNVIIKSGVNIGTKPIVFIGAHYDCAETSGQGAFDNGSGVATVFAIANDLKGKTLPFEIVYILFGAEEPGLVGSMAFVESLTQAQIDRTLMMINIDTVAAGDYLYIYTEDVSTNFQDFIVSKSEGLSEFSLNALPVSKSITTVVGGYPAGTPYMHIGQMSDHMSFRERGIPTAMFFSGNLSTQYYGYVESAVNENIMHTENDLITVMDSMYGTEYISRMELTRKTVIAAVTDSQFEAVMANARQELVNTKVWFNILYPAIIYSVILCLFGLFCYFKLRKLRIKSLTDATVIKPMSVFKRPDEEDIFTFRNK